MPGMNEESLLWLAASVDERADVRTKIQSLPEQEQQAFITLKVNAFIQKRDEAFEKMRASLEEKRKALTSEQTPEP